MAAPWLLCSSMLCVTLSARADLEASVLRCREISDPQARVACYDAIDIRQKPVVTASPAVVAPPSSVLAAPSAVAAADKQTPSAAAGFGLPVTVQPQQVQAIESRIAGLFEGWAPQARLELANGQVWQVSDDSNGAYTLRDPKVRITRGLLGSYFLQIDGVSQTPKVKRIR